MKEYTIVYAGQPMPAKRPRFDSRSRRSYNDKGYQAVLDDFAAFIVKQWGGVFLEGPIKLVASFYRKDERHVDLDNLLKTVMDACQIAGIYKNDSQITTVLAMKGLDKDNPRTEFTLQAMR